MKRKRKVAKPKLVPLKNQIPLLRSDVDALTKMCRTELQNQIYATRVLGDMVKGLTEIVGELKDTPLAAVREIDKVLGKLEDLGIEKAENVDRIFPNVMTMFNNMAEAVNKIQAYAKALDESGSGWSLRQNVRERIEEETDDQLLAKLRHRLARMEQKL